MLSVIANWAFLEMNVINLAANYSAVYEGWSNGRAVYTILVVQNGVGSGAIKTILLTLITVAIFFATISTAINYAQGFNDRILNWYQKRKQEAPEVSAAKRNKRGAVLTLVYIVFTWAVSQMGLTALVSKGLTFASIITLFTLIIPTIINVIRKWPDADYAHMTKENSNGSAGLRIHCADRMQTWITGKNSIVEGCCVPAAHSSGRSGTETFSMFFYCVCEGTETLRKMMKYEGESICYLLLD